MTGGTKGIGWAIADEMLALGATVTIAARGETEIEERLGGDTTGRLLGIAADVSTSEGRKTAVEFALAQRGGIDLLINNAGTNIRKASLDFSPDELGFLLDTNLVSAWELSRLAYPFLKASASESGDASIVNISSVAGSRAVGSGAPYAMTKAAMDQMTRYLAAEWGPDQIRTNAVLPWYTRTFRVSQYLDAPEFTERVLARTPLGRVAEPEDISGLAAFLCMPSARYITGQTIAADGGFLSYGFGFEPKPLEK